jgi:hypothetical protein
MIYLIIEQKKEYCKIGFSKNPVKRLSSMQTSHHCNLEILHIIEGDIKEEKLLHRKFENYKVKNEWFTFNDEILGYFKRLSLSKDLIKEKILNENTVIQESFNTQNPLIKLNSLKTIMTEKINGNVTQCFQSEVQIKSSVYDDFIFEDLFNTNIKPSTRDLFLYILINLEKDVDVVQLNQKEIYNKTGISKTSFYSAIKQLKEMCIIADKEKNSYWVNPYYIFKGNRLAFYQKNYPKAITVTAKKEINK